MKQLGESAQKSVLGVSSKVRLDGEKLDFQMAEVKAKMFVGEKVYVYACESSYTRFMEAVQEVRPLLTSAECVTLSMLTHFTAQLQGKCCKRRLIVSAQFCPSHVTRSSALLGIRQSKACIGIQCKFIKDCSQKSANTEVKGFTVLRAREHAKRRQEAKGEISGGDCLEQNVFLTENETTDPHCFLQKITASLPKYQVLSRKRSTLLKFQNF